MQKCVFLFSFQLKSNLLSFFVLFSSPFFISELHFHVAFCFARLVKLLFHSEETAHL